LTAIRSYACSSKPNDHDFATIAQRIVEQA
jgi:hypothetical protein